jgi:hypothetical protein
VDVVTKILVRRQEELAHRMPLVGNGHMCKVVSQGRRQNKSRPKATR